MCYVPENREITSPVEKRGQNTNTTSGNMKTKSVSRVLQTLKIIIPRFSWDVCVISEFWTKYLNFSLVLFTTVIQIDLSIETSGQIRPS